VEGLGLLDLVVGGVQVDGGSGNLRLEISEFDIQLVNSLLIVNDGLVLISSKSVDGIDHLVSEVLQHGDDLSQHSLVGEVLAGGQ